MSEAYACGLGYGENLQWNAGQILKQTQIQAVQSNTNDFCQRNMLLRALNASHVSLPNEGVGITTPELKADFAGNISTNDPWQASLVPTEQFRLNAFMAATEWTQEGMSPGYANTANNPTAQQVNDQINLLKTGFANPYLQSQDPTANYNGGMNYVDVISHESYRLPSLDSQFASGSKVSINGTEELFKTAGCAQMNLMGTESCKRGLDDLQQMMTPVTVTNLGESMPARFIPVSLWKKVLTSDSYDEGLRLAAQTVLDRMQAPPGKNPGNIFDDLTNSFVKAGYKTGDAKNMSIDVLGLIANGSVNTAGRIRELKMMPPQTFGQKDRALSVIAAALPVLDYRQATLGNGNLYSMPGSVQSTCDVNKSYHFWMAAYEAKTLTQDDHLSTGDAVNSSFVAEKGYQILRGQVGDYKGFRESLSQKVILTKPSYDPMQQVERMDLSFAAAGADFGANINSANPSRPVNLDHVLTSMVQNSNVVQPISSSEAANLGEVNFYLKWQNLISPNTALEAVENQN